MDETKHWRLVLFMDSGQIEAFRMTPAQIHRFETLYVRCRADVVLLTEEGRRVVLAASRHLVYRVEEDSFPDTPRLRALSDAASWAWPVEGADSDAGPEASLEVLAELLGTRGLTEELLAVEWPKWVGDDGEDVAHWWVGVDWRAFGRDDDKHIAYRGFYGLTVSEACTAAIKVLLAHRAASAGEPAVVDEEA